MNSLSLLDSFLSRSLSTSRTASPPDSPSEASASSSSANRRRRRPHSTTPATRTPVDEEAPTRPRGDDDLVDSPSPSGHLPRRNSDYALQTNRARAQRSDRMALGLQMTVAGHSPSTATGNHGETMQGGSSRRRSNGKGKAVPPAEGEEQTEDHARASQISTDGQARQPLRRLSSTPGEARRFASVSDNSPRWASSLWGIGSWLEPPLSASASSSGYGVTGRRWSTTSRNDGERSGIEGAPEAEGRGEKLPSRRRKRRKAESEGDSDGSAGDGTSGSGSSGSSEHDDDPSYRHLSRLELSGRLLFANRIFTPFGHPTFTASVPDLPSEVGVGVVGTSGLGGMEDIDTVDFEGGESDSDEDLAVAAAAAASVALEDYPASAPLVNLQGVPERGQTATPTMLTPIDLQDTSMLGVTTMSTQEHQKSVAEAELSTNYLAIAPGDAYDGGVELMRHEERSGEGPSEAIDSISIDEDNIASVAELPRDVELREAREASAALQSSIEEDERANGIAEAAVAHVVSVAARDEVREDTVLSAKDTLSSALCGLLTVNERQREEGPASPVASSQQRRNRSCSPFSWIRSILMLMRRAVLALVLAPQDIITFAISTGKSRKRRKIQLSLIEPNSSHEEREKTVSQSQDVEELEKKSRLSEGSTKSRSATNDADEVVTEEQALQRSERQRHAAAEKDRPHLLDATGSAGATSTVSGLASRLSKLLPNPHHVDPMLVHEPKAKIITGELPDEIVQQHQRGASLSLLKKRVAESVATLTPTIISSARGADGSATPPPVISPAATPVPRSVVIHHTPKILVLDLDETLIHSTSRSPTWTALRAQHSSVNGRTQAARHAVSTGGSLLGLEGLGGLLGLTGSSYGRSVRPHMVEVVLDGRSVIYHVYKRPWVDYFLRKVSTWYQVVIFTASVQEYGDPVIDWLDQGRGLIAGRLYRDACTYKNGSYLKDLKIVDLDLSRVCLVDNSPASYFLNPANGIPIEGWTHDPSDEALLDLLPVLDSLRFAQDVRHVLGLRITDGKS